MTSKPEAIPIMKSFAISTALHPATVLLIWLISIILALAGINLFKFGKVKPQIKRDIEFVSNLGYMGIASDSQVHSYYLYKLTHNDSLLL